MNRPADASDDADEILAAVRKVPPEQWAALADLLERQLEINRVVNGRTAAPKVVELVATLRVMSRLGGTSEDIDTTSEAVVRLTPVNGTGTVLLTAREAGERLGPRQKNPSRFARYLHETGKLRAVQTEPTYKFDPAEVDRLRKEREGEAR